MGGGSWSDDDYRRSVKGRGAFAFSDATLSRPQSEWRCHELLNPKGLKVRESRDSAEHPESNAVMIGLDVTGSMGRVVVAIQNSLGNLMDMLLKKEFVKGPQVLFYAVGDANTDTIPFQVSQFESDNRINDQLTKVVLEGNGGGQVHESYEMGLYCAARHTSIDCFEKRGRKGYLFSIGDEKTYKKVSADQVKTIFDADIDGDIRLPDIVREAQEKYHVFHIIPAGGNHSNDPAIRAEWAEILGGEQFVIMLENSGATAETIALAIGLSEGKVDFEDGLKAIADKAGQATASSVRRALEKFAEYAKNNPLPASDSADAGGTNVDDPKSKKGKKNWKI